MRSFKTINTMKNKTVYILGAGFSVGAGAPSQANLIREIFKLNNENPSTFRSGKIEEFQKFLLETMHLPETMHESVPLEDIYTPIDSCIINNTSFRNLSVGELESKRKLILELIGITLRHLLEGSDQDYIKSFAQRLVKQSKLRKDYKYRSIDNVSVLSTNWDILLDNAIFNELEHELAVVDYCCYVSSYEEHDDKVKPGLEILGKGGFNVKLLKLHGSLNWLQCPKCQRIYVKFNSKIALAPFSDIANPSCRHCDKNFESLDSHRLEPNLIMPTFLKDLSNPQYKIIWQNAGIELSEASKIVFIGYSLPQADFQMRQLLSRMVSSKTEIEVVDFRDPGYPEDFDKLIQNFKQFFGREIISHDKGAKYYINELPPI